MSYTYILHSTSLSKYYIGSTDSSVEERFAKHLTNHGGFTSKAKDWLIVYVNQHEDPKEAKAEEFGIKKAKSKKFIERLIVDFQI